MIDGRQYVLTDNDLNELKKKIVRKESEIQNGIYSDAPKVTLNEWFYKWMEVYKGNLKTQRERERERELIRQGLERYRTEPPDSNIRKGIDWLLQKHAAIQRCFSGSELENFKKRHNAVVLQYIIARPMNRNQIGKRLKTNIYIPDNVIEQGISELAQILFGYWD